MSLNGQSLLTHHDRAARSCVKRRAVDREERRGIKSEVVRTRAGGRAGERRGEEPQSKKKYIAVTLTSPPPCSLFWCECKKRRRGERGRKINPGSLSRLFALYSHLFFPFFLFFFYLHHPRHDGEFQLALQNIRKGCFLNAASLLTRDKEERKRDNKQDF